MPCSTDKGSILVILWHVFISIFFFIFTILGALLVIKTILPLACVGYEMITV